MRSDEWKTTVLNQGYHLESDVGWVGTSLRMGPAEREEMHRAEMIDALVAENRKQERRNFKGY